MFLGHYAVALAAKPAIPRRSAGWSFLAVQFLDILSAALVLLGVEKVRILPGFLPGSPLVLTDIAWSHGLVMALIWSWFCFRLTKSAVLAACVASHWVLDFIAHQPDLPVWRGGPLLGLGLWRWREGTLAVELILFATGMLIYMRSTRPRNNAGKVAMPVFGIVLAAMFVMSLYGPLPSSMPALAIGGEVLFFLLAGIAAFADSLREYRPGTALPFAEN